MNRGYVCYISVVGSQRQVGVSCNKIQVETKNFFGIGVIRTTSPTNCFFYHFHIQLNHKSGKKKIESVCTIRRGALAREEQSQLSFFHSCCSATCCWHNCF